MAITQTRNRFGLSNSDALLLKKQWAMVTTKNPNIGHTILNQLCETYPTLTQTFGRNSEGDGSYSHADKFVAFISNLVENINDDKHCATTLRSLGSKHADFAKFDAALYNPDYWTGMVAAAADCIATEANDDRAAVLWSMTLFRVIYEIQVHFNRQTSNVCMWYKAKKQQS